ncbi:YbjN domain-containing protein [Oharaeibacter diazotrophicus]|uniref:Putative sensory transduction regulator n=1 Tax=Oharaeibacter diazotrophicus TaxID=1920512 RepID=A0A4R6RMB5_9HYPH|nr:YbjN domain-containing protein [Oharaeibacter diazotrophicus]TDP87704.1 putative sensory transduction regulator [Oharaeibacter diazotrophicus]BBE74713.1 hypothetical protein OHA_1_04348 [Pleomorphomonas sp. SM30]GLS77095.1 hypothetical protein GCM10007904_24320 [Oharaeibacter diazotrophicus]
MPSLRALATAVLVLALSSGGVAARGERPAVPAPSEPAPAPKTGEPARSDAASGEAGTAPDSDKSAEKTYDLAIPADFAAAMRDLGYRADLDRTDGGRPSILSRVARTDFDVTFFGCEDDRRCTHVLVTATWDYGESGDPLAALNEWNDTKVFGRAWYHEDTDAVGLDVTWTLAGRIDLATLDDQLRWWNDAVEEFRTFLNENIYENGPPETQDASARDI